MWIVENSSFDRESTNALVFALDKLKIPYHKFDYKFFMSWKDVEESIKEMGDIKEPIFCYGSLNFISRIQKINYKPGSYCNFRNLECRNYYPKLLPYLLNQKYEIIQWKELIHNSSYFLKTSMFIRPNSGKKVFTGRVIYEEDLHRQLDLEFNRVEDNTLILISPVKEVIKEWRLFIIKNKVVTGCQFYENSELSVVPSYPREVENLALKVSNIYNPDPVFVVDIGKINNDEYKVIELNGMSCSGLYACDAVKIVEAVEDSL